MRRRRYRAGRGPDLFRLPGHCAEPWTENARCPAGSGRPGPESAGKNFGVIEAKRNIAAAENALSGELLSKSVGGNHELREKGGRVGIAPALREIRGASYLSPRRCSLSRAAFRSRGSHFRAGGARRSRARSVRRHLQQTFRDWNTRGLWRAARTDSGGRPAGERKP